MAVPLSSVFATLPVPVSSAGAISGGFNSSRSADGRGVAQHYARGPQGPRLLWCDSWFRLNALGCLAAVTTQVPPCGAGAVWLGGTGWTPLLGGNLRASWLPGPHPGHGHRLSLSCTERRVRPILSPVMCPHHWQRLQGQPQLWAGAFCSPAWARDVWGWGHGPCPESRAGVRSADVRLQVI